MANSEKDRFGDTLRQKEKAQEDEYFARRERELIAKLRGGQRATGDESRQPQAEGDPTLSRSRDAAAARESGSSRGWKAWIQRLFGGGCPDA